MNYKYDIYGGIQKYKTKTFIVLATLAFVIASSLMSLAIFRTTHAETVPGPWQLSSSAVIDFSCLGNDTHFLHNFNTVVQQPNGNFTGTGSYIPDPVTYTWDATGNITGSTISVQITYTGAEAGYVYNLTGTIASNGNISGTVDDVNHNCQTFTIAGTYLSHFDGNHGQYVSSQDDKKAAAQSRIGMPVQSKKK